MRLLVVGAAGQLGADLLAAGERGNESVRGLRRADLDVTDAEAVADILGRRDFDVLVNCTAYNDTAGAESDPVAAFRVNAHAPELLAAAAREAGARFVHVSTDYVFDGRSERPYTEDDPPAPLGIYGASKLTGEALARRAHPSGTIIIRTAALFGLAAVEGGGNFVETILRAGKAAMADGTGRVRGVDDIVVSPTAAADLAEGILALLRAEADAGLYHLVNGGRASWYDFARAIVEIADLDVEVEPTPATTYPSPVRRPPFSVLGTDKAAELIGPLPHWKQAVARYLERRGGEAPGHPAARPSTDRDTDTRTSD